jgi:hypothetical protein
MKKTIYIILTFLTLVGCSKKNDVVDNSISDEWIINPIIIDDLTFNLADNYTIEWSIKVNNYIEKFLELSPEILENKSEIEYAVCQIQNIPETHSYYQELGWTKTIQIKIKIKDKTTLPQDWAIAGAELFYYLGSGRIPGCIIQTKQEHLFSGFINENINLVIDNSFTGIDEIRPYTFKKQIPKITAKKFRQEFRERFGKFGGRQLDSWSELEIKTRILKIENNLKIILSQDDEDSIFIINLKYDDITKPLQYENDFYLSLCAIISINEPYLEAKQVEQFSLTMVNAKSYLEEYIEKENSATCGYWMPSGNKYYVGLGNNIFYVNVNFELEE